MAKIKVIEMRFYVSCNNCDIRYFANSKTEMAQWIETHLSDRLCSGHQIKIERSPNTIWIKK